jgi:hypothetical protein
VAKYTHVARLLAADKDAGHSLDRHEFFATIITFYPLR